MNDPFQALQALLNPSETSATQFPPTSRYHGVGTTQHVTADGRTIRHLKRRPVPSPDQFATLHEVIVAEGERLDHLAAKHLGDPEAFWRLCDANGVIRPAELETAGRALRITLPQGIPPPPPNA